MNEDTGGYVHTHVHTEFSLLDGQSNIKQLVNVAAQFGMPALAITDHGGMYGVVDFYQAAYKAGIKPIIGVEGYIVNDVQEREKFDYNHLLLFAMNNVGYQNLLKLVTLSHTKGFYYKPRMDKSMLLRHSEGLIVTSGCLAGEIPQLILADNLAQAHHVIEWYLTIFGPDRFYMELQNHEDSDEQRIVNAAIIEMAKRYGLRLLATNDLHYVSREDASTQDVMLCVQTGAKFHEPKRMHFGSNNYYLKSAAEMRALFSGMDDAIANTLRLAEQCNVTIEFGRDLMPRYQVPDGSASDTYLWRIAETGMTERYGPDWINRASLVERFNYEFNLILAKGFIDYFLIVWDYTNYARRQGMRCVARGSVAGSIVAYALGISNVDPLRYNLTFERFLNPDRTAMPDIDMDFPDDRREEVITYVAEKYGWENVGQIVTMNTMAAKAAVRDVARVFDDYATGDRISRLLPNGAALRDELEHNNELRDLYTHDGAARNILNFAKQLEGTVRNTGVHAAGVVISAVPLSEVVPCEPRDKKADGQTWQVAQYEQAHLEALGLLKMDFLGLSNLTILQRCQQFIRETHGIEIDLDHIPTDDAAVFELLGQGETTGVFQLESGAMRRYIRELKPSQVDDVMAMVALYRPGPMESIPRYIAAKHGRIQPTYPHPELEEILRETYGVIVYQDQVLLSVMKLAGFTWGEVDKFRKAIGKKLAHEMAEQKQKFIKGCAKHGIDEAQAEAIFAFIEPFAGYGFNRAHAAAYGWVAYQTAWLKVHYTDEFMAASLSKEAGNADKIALLTAECRRMGVTLLPPDVNKSGAGFTLEPEILRADGATGRHAVRFGFTAIKGIGEKPALALVHERDERGNYRNTADIFARCEARAVTSATITALAQAGALDSFGDRAALVASVEEAKKVGKKYRGQLSLFGEMHPVQSFVPAPTHAATVKQILEWERETLGVYLSAHPLDEVGTQLLKLANTRTIDVDESHAGTEITLAGRLIGVVHRKIRASGADMATGILEDQFGVLPVVAFSSVYAKNAHIWRNDQLVVLTGKVRTRNDDSGELQLVVSTARGFDANAEAAKAANLAAARAMTMQLQIRFASGGTLYDMQMARQIGALLKLYPGQDAYEVVVQKNGATQRLLASQGARGVDYAKVYMDLNALAEQGVSFERVRQSAEVAG